MPSKPSSSVWITGTGAVTCAGLTPQALWESALQEKSGIVEGLGRFEEASLATLRTMARETRVGRQLEKVHPTLAKQKSLLFSLTAIDQAFEQAGWDSLTSEDGFIFATTTGQIEAWEADLMDYTQGKMTEVALSETFQFEPLGKTLSSIAEALDFRGRSQVITTACAASTHALALAAMWIKQGKVRRCLVGGCEVLSKLTVEGFKSFQLLSPKMATPFDEKRVGINLSEGAAFLCLDSQSGKDPLGRLSGGGFTNDAFHMTAPHPEGKGCYFAMKQALKTSGLDPSDIDWVHAHGTGSPHNDLAESLAIGSLFKEVQPWVSSTKAVHGHALAASGAVESVLCLEALKRRTVLKTLGLGTPDPKISLKHPVKNETTNLRHIMKNTLGFGGSNAAVVISAP